MKPPNLFRALALLECLALLAANLAARAHSSRGSEAPPAHGSGQIISPSTLAEDKGKFRVLVGGAPAGQEQFSIAPDGANWLARGNAEVQVPNAPATRVTGVLTLKPDGTPVKYEWSTQGAKKASATVDFAGGVATIELRLEGQKPFTQQFFFPSARILVLDNNLFHQYAIVARLYDWQKKGEQDFAVLVPQTMTPGAVKVQSLGPQAVDGKQLELLRVKTDDLEVDLYLDNLRLMRIAVPASNAEVIRE
jgi:hypothetical protein